MKTTLGKIKTMENTKNNKRLITRHNLLRLYPYIDQDILPKELKQDEFEEYKDFLQFYDDDATIKQAVDLFILKLNEVLIEDVVEQLNMVLSNEKKNEKIKENGRKKEKKDVLYEEHKTPKAELIKRQKEHKTRTKIVKKAMPMPTSWMKALRLYKNAAGKEKTMNWVYSSLNFIQSNFNAKAVNSPTPNIELIRKIQNILVNAINSNLNKDKLFIEKNEKLTENINEALNQVQVSKKMPKPAQKNIDLKGIVNSTEIGQIKFDTI
ncbi:MAG: hypothetical protein JXR58_12955, partial [Bacteroidales bacterium]|nr:hypothetical protein [Bacteroidales bacterium]